MVSPEIIGRLSELIGGYLDSLGFELIELICRYEGRDIVLRVLTDKPNGGITMDECADLNRKLGNLLLDSDILGEEYTLEVSSPGLDRPLKNEKDFCRALNKKAVFFLNDLVGGKLQQEGIINKVKEGIVFVAAGQGEIGIPFEKITKAKIVI